MPGKLCFATLLVFSLLIGEGIGQHFLSSTFGAEVAAEISSNSTTSSQAEEQPRLVPPAIWRTPDQYVRRVQQASYSEPTGETPSDQDPAQDVTEPLNDRRSGAALGRDLRFPAWDPPSKSRLGGSGTGPPAQGLGSVVTVISSLAVVLGLFFMTAWLMRRTGRGGFASLPEDVFEVLGRAQLNHRQQVHFVRCGTKLLLVSLTPDSAETLTEIDDPDEVTRLAGLCKARQAGSASVAFRHVLHQFAGQPAEPGFIGRTDSRTTGAELPSELENHHG